MFLGRFDVRMDRRGAMTVPKKFREQLTGESADKLVVTNFVFEGLRCLDVYPLPAWEAFREPYDRLPKFDARVIKFQVFYFGGAYVCTLDRRGRLSIPAELRRFAELSGEIVMAGASTKVQVWNREIWDKAFAAARDVMIGDHMDRE